MQIDVARGTWGKANIEDIKMLLRNVATHFVQYFRNRPDWNIMVLPTIREDDDPVTCYRPTEASPYLICLSARNRKWAQFSYQFAHELCHVASNYERLKGNPNNWFHESLCELASIFTLRRMADGWTDHAPYAHWNSYSESLATYARNYVAKPERQLPRGFTLGSWLAIEEPSLRSDKYQRDKNAIVAYACLPVFENNPMGWNAIRNLPDSSVVFKEYLRDWHSQVESQDKQFVGRVMQLFDK